jgi:KH/beta-lactamase-domain protein
MELEAAEKAIKKILPKECAVAEVIFDPPRSIVIVEVEKPGLAIGKQGALLREIREKTMWVPVIRRSPAIKSKIINNIREVLYQESDYRRKFLDKVGHRIYDGWLRGKKQEWVRLTFLGGARQVGRSCLFLQTPESRILMDCGIDVSTEIDPYPALDVPEFNIQDLDAVIVTHAHTDHGGFVPYLFKYGYRGPVYCTAPTRDMMALMQLDYVKIAKGENKPLIYDVDDVKEMIKHTITLDWEAVTDITPDVRLTLYNSGHILGSSQAHLNIGNGLHNIVYSADIKYGKNILLDPAHTKFPRCETLIMEATYGGKTNVLPSVKEEDGILMDKIKTTIAQNGKVLMPVLGSGKAQEMIVLVVNGMLRGDIPEVPVYVDGMVWDITAIYTAYPEFLNNVVRKSIFHKDQNPFLHPKLNHVGSAKERKKVVEEEGSCVIIATSGMLVGGPSVEYLRNLGDNPHNSLIFSSYLGPGSLGRRVMNGEKDITFQVGNKKEIVPIKLDILKIEISDHSDRKQLMNYVYQVEPRPKRVILNHGEVSRCLDLASSIHKQNRIETVAPRMLETLRLK